MRRFLVVRYAAALFFLASCIPVPVPVSEAPPLEGRLEFLEIGSTTRKHVLFELGAPVFSAQEEQFFGYLAGRYEGGIYFLGYGAAAGLEWQEIYFLGLEFDQDSILVSYDVAVAELPATWVGDSAYGVPQWRACLRSGICAQGGPEGLELTGLALRGSTRCSLESKEREEISNLDFIKPGTTTKAEVRRKLDEPDMRQTGPKDSRYAYCGRKSRTEILGIGTETEIDFCRVVVIDFDDSDIVTTFDFYESWSMICKTNYFLEFQTLEEIESRQRKKFDEQLEKACAGNKLAQYVAGRYYDRGEGVEKSSVEAFKWYSLIESERSEATQYFKDMLRQRMTLSEIAEAERLVAEWQPNQAGCAARPVRTAN